MTTRLFLALLLLLTGCASLPATAETPTTCKTRWTGEINDEFTARAHKDIASAIGSHCKVLQISLYSPGGSVVDGLEVVRAMLAAQPKLIIAVHGGGMVASMATVVLAAGTPGYRTIDPNTFTLVHPMRKYNGECVSLHLNPSDETGKIENEIIHVMAFVMAELTGQSLSTTLEWLKCENSLVGNGFLLVKLGFADRVQR